MSETAPRSQPTPANGARRKGTDRDDRRDGEAVDHEGEVSRSTKRKVTRGPQIRRKPDRPAPKEDRVCCDRGGDEPKPMIAPDAANALKDPARRVLVSFERSAFDQAHLGCIRRPVLIGSIGDE